MSLSAEADWILVDWGTSNVRLWACQHDGTLIAEKRSDKGMARLHQADYEPHLAELLSDVAVKAGCPILICGMAGAAAGWHEAAYLDTPADLQKLAQYAVSVPDCAADIRIIPGVAQRHAEKADVMRGEETLLYGAYQDTERAQLFCLPGTHSKWVRVQNGVITDFTTIMTGELFDLITSHSILAKTLTIGDFDKAAFHEGLGKGYQDAEHLTSQLFHLRASALLFGGSDEARTSFLSGLLIGAEIKGQLGANIMPVTLIASSQLANYYEIAFSYLNIPYQLCDSEKLAQIALLSLAQQIWEQ